MPYERKGKCVYKKGNKKPVGCSDSVEKAKDYLIALYANMKNEHIIEEIKDYFNKKSEKEYLEFDNHPLSKLEKIIDPSKPAPWDHLTNDINDEDIDIKIQEIIKK